MTLSIRGQCNRLIKCGADAFAADDDAVREHMEQVNAAHIVAQHMGRPLVNLKPVSMPMTEQESGNTMLM